MSKVLRDIVSRNKAGETVAIPSVCSAHPEVLTAALQLSQDREQPLVIEATSNQVNQFGGYTGMDAEGFVSFVDGLIENIGIDKRLVVLGGDHLGPQVWKSEAAETAIPKARDLVADYVRAGINKIHLDCSEGCAGEPAQVDDATAARRAADLAIACRNAAHVPENLSFVIGTEVPPPGGARLDDHGHVTATSQSAARATLVAHQEAFDDAGIIDLWPQVSGLVVQPGVEFGPDQIYRLPLERDPGLRGAVAEYPGICLEAHSTDYQTPDVFPRLAEMGFAFQKVGPALTHAWRRAVYRMDHICSVLCPTSVRLPDVIEAVMREHPQYWKDHYSEDDPIQRHYSYADRIRYYWPMPEVQACVRALLKTIDELNLPDHVFNDVFGELVTAGSADLSQSRSLSLARAQVQLALAPYFFGEHGA